MSTLEEIETALQQLGPADLGVFRAWYEEFDAQAWDRQFERNVAEGRLDELAEEALGDLAAGRATEL